MSTPAPVQPFLTGMESEERKLDLSQFFTPEWLARKLWGWCPKRCTGGPWRVLEPAAGLGSLVRPMLEAPHAPEVVAYEVDRNNVGRLAQVAVGRPGLATVRPRDFLAQTAAQVGYFDLTVMNPPYEGTQGMDFIMHALECSPQVVGLFPANLPYSQGRWAGLWRWVDVRRLAHFEERPHFGGPHSPKTDFCVLDLHMRRTPRLKGEPTTHTTEWW